MKFTLKELIFACEENEADSEHNCEDFNTEVVVLIEEEDDNGLTHLVKYSAPFFTYRNIDTVRKEHEASGEFLHGKYFWANGLTLIDECCRESLEEVIKHLIDEGDFRSVFKSISVMN